MIIICGTLYNTVRQKVLVQTTDNHSTKKLSRTFLDDILYDSLSLQIKFEKMTPEFYGFLAYHALQSDSLSCDHPK